MRKIVIDNNWRFSRAGGENTIVHLPHDAQIGELRSADNASGSGGAYYGGGIYTYKNNFDAESPCAYIEIEGAYQWVEVNLNGDLIAQRPYGYSSFVLPITVKNENQLTISVNNAGQPNSRWYSGAGLYRHVNLFVGGHVHIPPRGVVVKPARVSSEISELSLETTVVNSDSGARRITLRHSLCGSDGAVASCEQPIYAHGEIPVVQSLTVTPARLWSVDDPYLYLLKTQLLDGDTILDETVTRVGIRSISVDTVNGFMLNGVSMKMRGGCVHHDNGPLGSAAFDRAEYRKVELLKASGFNALRTAHNPPSPALLNACDELGMLVIDENFDCWREGKNPHDYHLFFEVWCERDTREMVTRDINHPSVVMWSIGNEVGERDGRSGAAETARRLVKCVRELDSTRPITTAICLIQSQIEDNTDHKSIMLNGMPDPHNRWGQVTRDIFAAVEVAGYNYLKHRYQIDAHHVICGTETFPLQAYEYWRETEKYPHVIGDFVWTSWDYIGEAAIGRSGYEPAHYAGAYPWHLAHCGDIDITGVKRPQSYFRDILWGMRKTPYIAVQHPADFGKPPMYSTWGWSPFTDSITFPGYEGRPILVTVYADADAVELMHNGISVGRSAINELVASFETTYQPGNIEAIAYKNGVAIGRSALNTSGAPAAIRLTADTASIPAGRQGLAYVAVEVIDAQGQRIPYADDLISFTVSGSGTLQAVGSANPVDEDAFTGKDVHAYQGRALAIIRSDAQPGDISITATAVGLTDAQVIIKAE